MALKLKGSTSGFVGLDAPSVAGNNTLILPENSGSAFQVFANDITAGVTTFTTVTVNRNGDLTVPGTISIGGTLTYEDVTSVDSIGIVTARGLSIFGNTTGLQVASGISTFQAVTATTGTFSGNVSMVNVVASGSIETSGGDLIITDSIIHSGDTNTKIRFPLNDTISFETAGSERLSITSVGKIGVNVTPSTGQFVVKNSDDSNLNVLEVYNDNGNMSGGFSQNSSGDGTIAGYKNDGTLSAFFRSNGDSYLTGGNFGLGTNSPSSLLHLSGSGPRITFTDTAGTNDIAKIFSSSGALYLQQRDGSGHGEIIFRTENDSTAIERMRITSAGKVGINENSPAADLHVCTAGSNDQDGIVKLGGSSTDLGFVLEYDQSSATVAKITSNPTYTNTGALLKICVDGDANADQLVLSGEGNIGINASSNLNNRVEIGGGGHYVVTNSGQARKGIHIRGSGGNAGEFGGAISFGCNASGGTTAAAAIAAEQMSSDGDTIGLAFFTHESSTGSDNAEQKLQMPHTGGLIMMNQETNRGYLFDSATGSRPTEANIQNSAATGMIAAKNSSVAQNTVTNLGNSHWGGLAYVGYSGTGHQGFRLVAYGYGGAGVQTLFSGQWVGSLTTTFSMSAYTLRVSHNASNALEFWLINLGV